MKTPLLKATFLAGLGTLGASVAHAHRVWLLPSTTVLSGKDQWISVEAAVSNNLFFPNHRPVQLASVDVKAPDGSSVELKNATAGEIRSSFELQLEKQGTYIISLKPSTGRGGGGGGPAGPGPGGPGAAKAGPAATPGATPGAQKGGGKGGGFGGAGSLSGSYQENGKTERWRGTPETLVSEGMAKKPGFKLQTSGGRRVATFVTVGAPSTEVLKPTGEGLEIDFVTHPNDLFTGEASTFRFLMDGKPAAGAEVTIVRGDDRFRNDVGELKITAGADGVAQINWPAAGRYWVQASASAKGELHGVPLEKSSSYILILEVLPQ